MSDLQDTAQRMAEADGVKQDEPHHGYWQLCPKCNGEGQLPSTNTTAMFRICDVCNGAKILARPIIENSKPLIP